MRSEYNFNSYIKLRIYIKKSAASNLGPLILLNADIQFLLLNNHVEYFVIWTWTQIYNIHAVGKIVQLDFFI